MIPSDLAARLRTLTEASFFDSEPPIQGTAKVREIQAKLPQLMPGQQFSATLQRSLPDGTFQALVGDRNYTLALNHPAKPGDTLELIVTRNGPNAVFAEVLSPLPGAAAAEASRPNLSQTGRLISFVLTGQPAPPPAALAEGKPLLNAPPTASNASATLAPALRDALGRSGLFYESHQTKWLAGKIDTASLLSEPQSRLSGLPSANTPQSASNVLASLSGQSAPASSLPGQTSAAILPSASGLSVPAAGVAPPQSAMTGMSGTLAGLLLGIGLAPGDGSEIDADGNPLPGGRSAADGTLTANAQRTGSAAQMAERTQFAMTQSAEGDAAAKEQQAATRAPGVPDRLLPVVHQQLDAMATQNYVLQGQAWPGQTFQWEIEDPSQESGGNADSDLQDWNTTLKLTLPNLGGVEARLQLTRAGVAIKLMADGEQAVSALDAAQTQLESALEAANLPLLGFVVELRDGE